MKLIINDYSSYKTSAYYVEDTGDRIASIYDKLIELAFRKCDSYASDVFWDMYTFYKSVRRSLPFDKILTFTQHGVNSNSTLTILSDCDPSTIREYARQQDLWRLTHTYNQEERQWKSCLVRIRLSIEE